GFVDFLQGTGKRIELKAHVGYAARRPELRGNTRSIEMMGNLLLHERGLLRNLLSEVGILRRGLVNDDAQGGLQGVGKIADVGSGALDHASVGLDKGVHLLLQRQNLIGRRAFQLRFLPRPDRGYFLADILKRTEPEADLEECRQQKACPEKGKREHDRVCKIAGLVIDLRRIEGDGYGENPALVLLPEVDVPLQDSKDLAVRPVDVALAHLL